MLQSLDSGVSDSGRLNEQAPVNPELLLSSYHFDLPERLIAQEPAHARDASRLLCLERQSSQLSHRRFSELPGLLREGDVLVVNNTRVIPARLFGKRASGGKVEIFLLEPVKEGCSGLEGRSSIWRALLNPSSRIKRGEVLWVSEELEVRVESRAGEAWHITLLGQSELEPVLQRVGQVPTPPYIKRPEREDPRRDVDRARYQTVYAASPGAVAAPTAGLHFTPELLASLETLGVKICPLTLHVGPGTFSPIRTERIDRHTLHSERFEVEKTTWQTVMGARRDGRRVIAVGTTSVRTLETLATRKDLYHETESGALVGATDIFIRPGYSFGAIDAIITNFHLPCSSLILLIAAFVGRERILSAYRTAVEDGYRFFSYGDAMFIT